MDPDKLNDYYTEPDPQKKNPNTDLTENSESPQPAGAAKTTISFDTNDDAESSAKPDTSKDTPKKRRHLLRKFLISLGVIVIIVGAFTIYIRYFNPYVTDAKVTGYITNVERRGIIFKTYEGEMISQQKLTDPTHVYSRDFSFTVPNDSLARQLQQLQGNGHQVTLTYDKYWGVLPWRGGSTIVVTSIEE